MKKKNKVSKLENIKKESNVELEVIVLCWQKSKKKCPRELYNFNFDKSQDEMSIRKLFNVFKWTTWSYNRNFTLDKCYTFK